MAKFADDVVAAVMMAKLDPEECVEEVDKIGVGQEGYEATDMEEVENEGLNDNIAVEEEKEIEEVAEDADLVEDYEVEEKKAADKGIHKDCDEVGEEYASEEEEEGEALSNAIVESNHQAGKFIVRLRTSFQAKQFIAWLQALITKQRVEKKVVVFEDFDISRTSFATNVLKNILFNLANRCVHVERFRAFGITTLNNEVCSVLALWLKAVSYKNTPFEMHLSDCAISNEGFQYIMEALEDNDAFPGFHPRFSSKVPMYLRLENNYIDRDMIQKQVDSGVLMTTRKKDHPDNNDQAKARLLILDWGGKFDYQQIKGKPPKPQNAPLAKHIKSIYLGRKSNKGKGTEKSGKGKTSKGFAQAALPAPRKQTRVVAEPLGIDSSWSKSIGIRSNYHNNYKNSRSNQYEKKEDSKSSRWEANYSKDKRSHRDSYSDEKYSHRDSYKDSKYSKDSYNSRYHKRDKEYDSWKSDDKKWNSSDSHDNSNRRDNKSYTSDSRNSRSSPNDRTRQTTTSKKRQAPRESDVSKKQHSDSGVYRLSAPWEEHWSEVYRLPYFWNSKSGESTWCPPFKQNCILDGKT